MNFRRDGTNPGDGPTTERASVTVFGAAVVLLVVMLATFAVRVGVATNERTLAQAAADAAALAGAADGRTAAQNLATRNGAVLVGYEEQGNDVAVTVTVGRAMATAVARHSKSGGVFVDLTTNPDDTDVTDVTDLTGGTDPVDTTAPGPNPNAETIVNGVIILRPPTTTRIGP